MVMTALPIAQDSLRDHVTELLDTTLYRLAKQNVGDAMASLVTKLGTIWSEASRDEWSRVVAACKRHPLYEVLDQDPFTHRARAKPRGYAGDAVMIDYIYRGLTVEEQAATTPLGQQIFEYTAGFSASARSVRERRDMLASRIDSTAARVRRPRILSVACGHLREAALSNAVASRTIGTIRALDQDPHSLEVVRAEYAGRPEVEVVPGSVRDLVKGTLKLDGFDLIYAAGLFDYLPTPVARSLVAVLVSGLNSGGELLVGNFLPAPTSVGYMEACMDWTLLWRTEQELIGLVESVDRGQLGSQRTFIDTSESVTYLEVTRC